MDGKPLGSRYLLTEVIGRGAMGRVYRATQRDGGPDVAVKLLREDLTQEPSMVARFVRERDVISSISHPNVVTVHEIVVDGDQLGIVMDLFPAGHLRRTVPPPVAPREAVQLIAQMASGLAAVHAAGVVHRDLKPENVLVSLDQGSADLRITDFGIAKLVGSTTNVTSAIGTPGYLAPEVTMGEPARRPADVYALGVMLFEWTTGQVPFVAENTFAMMRAHAQDPVQRPVGMPDELADLAGRMLAKQPEQRPVASEVAERLLHLAPTLTGTEPWRERGSQLLVPALQTPAGEPVPDTIVGSYQAATVLRGDSPLAGAPPMSGASPMSGESPNPLPDGRFRPPTAATPTGVELAAAGAGAGGRRRGTRVAIAAAAAAAALAVAAGGYLLSRPDPVTALAAPTPSGSTSASPSSPGVNASANPRLDQSASAAASAAAGGSSGGPAARGVVNSAGGQGGGSGKQSTPAGPAKPAGPTGSGGSGNGSGGGTGGGNNQVPAVTKPGAVASMNLSAPTQTTMALTWGTAPRATGYRLGWTESGSDGRTWTSDDVEYGADRRNVTLINLRPGRTYNVTITPLNSAGTGTVTRRSLNTAEAPSQPDPQRPGAVSSMSLSGATQTTLNLAWGTAEGATGYRLGWTESGSDGRTWTSDDVEYGADRRSVTLINLRPGRTYAVTVTPLNSAGTGPVSSRSADTTG